MRKISGTILKKINFLVYRFQYLINYIIIGILSVLLEIIIIKYILVYNMPFLYKVVIGFSCGVLLAFILNSKLNFKVPKSKNKRTFILYLIISTLALILNLALIEILKTKIPLGYSSLRLITSGMVFLLSYTAHRRITFDFVKKVGIAIYLTNNRDISEIYTKIRYYADFIHIDLVDKSFIKDASDIDLSLIKEINRTWGLKKILHIMSKKPSGWIKKLSRNIDVIIFHLNIEESIEKNIMLCKSLGKEVGICLETSSNVNDIIKYLPKLKFIQVMGIDEIGKSGQSFNPDSLIKVRELNELKKKYNFEIIFDGGVKPTNVGRINAKYIVSASGILSSQDPIKSFMELKTSSRYRHIEPELRGDIIKRINSIADNLDFVISGNIVGSFSENNGLKGINDIDIVIITDKLTKNNFEKIVKKFQDLKKDIESKYGYRIIINPTLGPLKFNKDCIVFHLMLYDEKSHKEHCEKSPFTCYDWQRSGIFIKKPMSEIYKVRFLQPSYFFNSRRNAKEYLSEILSNQLSYREYKFNSDSLIEEKKYKTMDSRDRIEFSYHIIKFLILNFLKLYHKENRNFEFKEMLKEYFKIFPKNEIIHRKLIKELISSRERKVFQEPINLIKRIELFIKDFESQFKDYFYNYSRKLIFLRHAETDLNKNKLFIGQKSDPGIINLDKTSVKNLKSDLSNVEILYSSQMKRCINTLKMLSEKTPIIDKRLNEIDYGSVDGKDFDFLSYNYPDIIQEWGYGNDPKFPNGENNRDVFKRVSSFMSDIKKINKKKILICTHNVFLRVLIGSYLKIPQKDWYKIEIPYFTPIKFIIAGNNRFYIDLSDNQIRDILKNL